jgi:hypothetical protein
MNTTGLDLVGTIRDLAALDDGVCLPQLQRDWAEQCRGLPRDSAQWFPANSLLHVQAVSRALSVLFDLPYTECEAAVRSVLLSQPRRECASSLINAYLAHSAPHPRIAQERIERNLT